MADLRKPVFFSTEASILGCTKLADNLFQYDEVEVAPVEIVNGLGVMPPEDSFGKYQIWSNTYTLGMTGTSDARPVFYAADINDLNDILVGVNTIASRLGLSRYTDPNDGRTWLEGISEVYVHALESDPTVCDPSVVMPVLGASGPGGLSSSLGFMPRATRYFSGGGTITSFDTLNLTKTYACTLEAFNDFDHISGTGWFGYADGLYTSNTGLTYGSGLPQVGDVIYRDPAGNNYFPENHGFVYQGFESTDVAGGSWRIGLRWVSVGANGVVTSVDKMIDL